jgi:1-acyl-sn-glycerol-3-phosphate acyltransferase
MQEVVVAQPYRFVPPRRSRLWYAFLRPLLPTYLRRAWGVIEVRVQGAEMLRQSVAAGHGIIVAPNHCRESDPTVLGALALAAGSPFYLMASWHVFMQGRLQRFLARAGGAFSIYREGMDRQALAFAAEVLERAERPLVLFPEGAVSLANDHLNSLMDGVALIARQAARKRAKAGGGRVVIHPVAIRYRYAGTDLAADLAPSLARIEQRLSWQPQTHLPLQERIVKLGQGLLALKEVEYLGAARTGDIGERVSRLIDAILMPLERQWAGGQSDGTVVVRVKRLRSAIVPDLVSRELDEAERQRRERYLADVTLAQALSLYRPNYISSNPTPERMLETVQRFEEDLVGRPGLYPLRAQIAVAPALDVSPERDEGLLERLEAELRRLLGIGAG